MIKRLLIALSLIPVVCSAQQVELTLKAGIVSHKILKEIFPSDAVKYPVGFSGGAAITFRMPANFRMGLGISAHELKAEVPMLVRNNVTKTEHRTTGRFSLGRPFMPVELILMKRFNAGLFRIDVGMTGGMSMSKKTTVEFEWESLNDEFVDEQHGWYAYGPLVGAQYRVSKKVGLGMDAQLKRVVMGEVRGMITSVTAKMCIAL